MEFDIYITEQLGATLQIIFSNPYHFKHLVRQIRIFSQNFGATLSHPHGTSHLSRIGSRKHHQFGPGHGFAGTCCVTSKIWISTRSSGKASIGYTGTHTGNMTHVFFYIPIGYVYNNNQQTHCAKTTTVRKGGSCLLTVHRLLGSDLTTAQMQFQVTFNTGFGKPGM